jgi:hypothetical protein
MAKKNKNPNLNEVDVELLKKLLVKNIEALGVNSKIAQVLAETVDQTIFEVSPTLQKSQEFQKETVETFLKADKKARKLVESFREKDDTSTDRDVEIKITTPVTVELQYCGYDYEIDPELDGLDSAIETVEGASGLLIYIPVTEYQEYISVEELAEMSRRELHTYIKDAVYDSVLDC